MHEPHRFIRPFLDEATLQGAAAFSSTEWLVAHMLAMVAFTLLPIGIRGLHISLKATGVENIGNWSVLLSMIGTGLTLPFYGGEAFGLHAIGQEAIRQQNADLIRLAADVRSGAGLYMFLIGLLLLAIAMISAAIAIWKSGNLQKGSGIPLAVGFALYIPQFFCTQPLRVAHGMLITIGCLWLAAGLWRQSKIDEQTSAGIRNEHEIASK